MERLPSFQRGHAPAMSHMPNVAFFFFKYSYIFSIINNLLVVYISKNGNVSNLLVKKW